MLPSWTSPGLQPAICQTLAEEPVGHRPRHPRLATRAQSVRRTLKTHVKETGHSLKNRRAVWPDARLGGRDARRAVAVMRRSLGQWVGPWGAAAPSAAVGSRLRGRVLSTTVCSRRTGTHGLPGVAAPSCGCQHPPCRTRSCNTPTVEG